MLFSVNPRLCARLPLSFFLLFGAVQKLSNRIKKLQESELTLEDMDSEYTNYVLEEKCVIISMSVEHTLCTV